MTESSLHAALTAVAEEWRYKGEFGWGPWQTGEGPDLEGRVLDDCSARLRALLAEHAPTSELTLTEESARNYAAFVGAEAVAARAEAEVAALRQQADDWKRTADQAVAARDSWRVRTQAAEQTVAALRRQVESLRAPRLCSQCGERESCMVKVGTADGWCATCLDEAAETAQAQVIERVRALGDKTAEWYPTNRRRITVDELRAALDAAPTPPTEAKGCGHTFPDGTACSLSAEAHAMPGMAHHCIPPTTDEEARLKFLDEAEADLFPTPTATGAHAWDPETPCPCGRPDTCPATPPTTDAEES